MSDLKPAPWSHMDNLIPDLAWDWPGWLPRGYLTILASEPGAGKSLLSLRLAASYLDGRPWPDDTPFDHQTGRVLWCESESSHGLNLDRAQRWGLDLSRIYSPLHNPLHNFKLDDEKHALLLLHLSRHPGIRLVVLDSLRGLHTKVTSAGASAEAVYNLSEFARIAAKPFLLTHHLRKRTHLDVDGRPTLDRLRGSGLIAQSARMVWILDTPDPARPDHRRLSVIKNNLAPFPPPIGMTIDDDGPHFGPPPEPPALQTALDRAIHFLRQALEPGPQPANQLLADCHAAALSETTVRRAKRLLGVASVKLPGNSEWYWTLASPPQDGHQDPIS